MLEDQEERKAGVQKIIELRNEDKDIPGDLPIRPRITPTVNPNVTSFLELIDWSVYIKYMNLQLLVNSKYQK